MAEEPQRIFIKPPDFASVYADGVIVRLERQNLVRLVFYQKSLDPTEDGRALNRGTEYINLKFEVRVPQRALEEVTENLTEVFKLKEDAWKMQKRVKRDSFAKDSWYNFEVKSDMIVFGSEDFLTSQKEIQELGDDFENLKARAKKKKHGETPDEPNKVQ